MTLAWQGHVQRQTNHITVNPIAKMWFKQRRHALKLTKQHGRLCGVSSFIGCDHSAGLGFIWGRFRGA